MYLNCLLSRTVSSSPAYQSYCVSLLPCVSLSSLTRLSGTRARGIIAVHIVPLFDSSLASRFFTSFCAHQTPLTTSSLGRQTHLAAPTLATPRSRRRSFFCPP